MAYIDIDYVKNAVGSSEVDGFTGNDDSILTDQLIPDAEALVDASLDSLGYAVPVTGTIPQLVKRMTLGALLPTLFGRKGLEVREALQSELNIFNQIASGQLKVPALKPKEDRHAYGGTVWNDRDKVFGKKLRDSY